MTYPLGSELAVPHMRAFIEFVQKALDAEEIPDRIKKRVINRLVWGDAEGYGGPSSSDVLLPPVVLTRDRTCTPLPLES